VYLWADGVYVKAGLEDTKAALLVLIGACADGRKVILAVGSGQRASNESWATVLRYGKPRGQAERSDPLLNLFLGARLGPDDEP